MITNLHSVKTNSIAALVDEFADLHAQVKAYEKTLTRYEHLRKLLSEHASQVSEGEVRLCGSFGFVSFTAPSSVRTMNNLPKYLDIVGLEAFLDTASVSVTKADKLLNEQQKSELFSYSVGSRKLKDCGRISQVLLASVSA